MMFTDADWWGFLNSRPVTYGEVMSNLLGLLWKCSQLIKTWRRIRGTLTPPSN